MRALLILAALATPAGAEGLQLTRGLNLDIWVEGRSVGDMLTEPGFLTPFPDWRRHMPPGRIESLTADGFDFVRFALDPAPMLALGRGERRAAMVRDIRDGVDLLQRAGLAVVVDLHIMPRPGEPWDTETLLADPAAFNAYLDLVAEVGAGLHGLPPDRTAFEPMNEPVVDCQLIWDHSDAPGVWPGMLARMHDAAREGAPDLPLVLSGSCWGGVQGLLRLDPAVVQDDNVIWSFHSYDPFTFTHQYASWTRSPLMFLQGVPYPPSALTDDVAARRATEAAARAAVSTSDLAEDVTVDTFAAMLADYRALPDSTATDGIAQAVAWADAHGIPHQRLLLGEFGAMGYEANGRAWGEPARHAFLADVSGAAQAAGVGWAVWEWTGQMRVSSDNTTRAMDPAICTALTLAGCAGAAP